MIQAHVEALTGPSVSHSGVYLHEPDVHGCNWNVSVNCDELAEQRGEVISEYLDQLRKTYVIDPDDPTAVRPAGR